MPGNHRGAATPDITSSGGGSVGETSNMQLIAVCTGGLIKKSLEIDRENCISQNKHLRKAFRIVTVLGEELLGKQ